MMRRWESYWSRDPSGERSTGTSHNKERGGRGGEGRGGEGHMLLLSLFDGIALDCGGIVCYSVVLWSTVHNGIRILYVVCVCVCVCVCACVCVCVCLCVLQYS